MKKGVCVGMRSYSSVDSKKQKRSSWWPRSQNFRGLEQECEAGLGVPGRHGCLASIEWVGNMGAVGNSEHSHIQNSQRTE